MVNFSKLKLSFEFLYSLYEPTELILVGTDATFWIETTKDMAFKKVSFIDADEHKINKLKEMNSLPSNWVLFNNLIYKNEENVIFYELSNSRLNGIISAQKLQSLWRNIYERNHKVIHAKRLKDVIKKNKKTSSIQCMVIECFGAFEILEGAENLLDTTDVVFAKSILSDNNLFEKVSHQNLNACMKKNGFKNIMFIEDNHPKIGINIYVRDIKKELKILNSVFQTKIQESEKLAQEQAALKEEKQKIEQALESEKANAAILQKEKDETAKALQNKNSEVEILKNELKIQTEELVNALEQEKQKSTNFKKEIDTLNTALQTKTQESEKLAQEHAALKEEKEKIAQALETEKANAVILQKEKEETVEALQNKNGEVETLKTELKTKTEALSNSLEQEKQKTIQVLEVERDLKNIDASSSLKEDIDRVSESFEMQVSSIIKKLDKKHTKEKIFLEKIKQEKKLVLKLLKLLREKEKSINSILADLKQLKGKLFIDCGGYDGCSAIKFLLKNPEYDVITFEPNSEMWDYYKDMPTKLIEKAVMHYDGVVDFTIDPIDGDGSSVIKEKKIDATNKVSNGECPIRSVDCVDLSAFIKKQSKKYAEIILKLDIEGAEYKVIQKIVDDGTLDFIDKIYAEFHWKKMGLEKSVHDGIVSLIQKKLVEEEWDALEFAVHKGTHKEQKIRRSILKGINKNG